MRELRGFANQRSHFGSVGLARALHLLLTHLLRFLVRKPGKVREGAGDVGADDLTPLHGLSMPSCLRVKLFEQSVRATHSSQQHTKPAVLTTSTDALMRFEVSASAARRTSCSLSLLRRAVSSLLD